MTNREIAVLLRRVAASYSIKDERRYRFQIIAYQRAADALESSSNEIKDMLKEEKLITLPGVGASISEHLKELVKTGHVKHFETVMQGVPQTMFPLLDVPTFGPKKAYRLVTHFKLDNPKTVLQDLAQIAKDGRIAELEGFGEKSEQDILRALNEFEQGKGKTTRMVLPYAAELADTLVTYLKKSKDIQQAYPLGSLRRMASTIGDIDIAVATKNPKAAIEHFLSYPHKERIIEKGDISASFLTSGGRQVDLMVQQPDSFGSLLQHFTGSKNHNIHLRENAIKMGLSLSEKGIKNAKKPSNPLETYKTEEAFYKRLGMQWIPPEMREDTGEIELALDNKLPKLIELSDIKGDLHIHSNFLIEPSHDLGQNSFDEMLDNADKLGYEYLGFSEHNPSVSKHTSKEIYSLIERRNERIEHILESNKSIRVIKMLEIDILTNGELAIDDNSLSLLDGAIVSIHSSFSMDKKDMTKRVLQGLSHPKAKILAHPTGRLLNERTGYDLDWEQVFTFCKKHKKALEINAWPQRLDLPDILVRQAVEQGVKLVINSDSHAADQMKMMRFGVAVARRGWAKTSDILNTFVYNDFIEWLKE